MKKIIITLCLALALCAALSACGGGEEPQPQQQTEEGPQSQMGQMIEGAKEARDAANDYTQDQAEQIGE